MIIVHKFMAIISYVHETCMCITTGGYVVITIKPYHVTMELAMDMNFEISYWLN